MKLITLMENEWQKLVLHAHGLSFKNLRGHTFLFIFKNDKYSTQFLASIPQDSLGHGKREVGPSGHRSEDEGDKITECNVVGTLGWTLAQRKDAGKADDIQIKTRVELTVMYNVSLWLVGGFYFFLVLTNVSWL